MAEETRAQDSFGDRGKLTAAALLLAAAVVLFYYFAEESLLFRVLGLLAATAISIAIFFTTAIGRETGAFLKASRVELQKVIWPTKNETLQTTLVILLAVLLVALFLWAIDLLLAQVMSWLIY